MYPILISDRVDAPVWAKEKTVSRQCRVTGNLGIKKIPCPWLDRGLFAEINGVARLSCLVRPVGLASLYRVLPYPV